MRNETAHLFPIQRLQRIDRPVTRLRVMLDRICNRSRRTRPHVRILVTLSHRDGYKESTQMTRTHLKRPVYPQGTPLTRPTRYRPTHDSPTAHSARPRRDTRSTTEATNPTRSDRMTGSGRQPIVRKKEPRRRNWSACKHEFRTWGSWRSVPSINTATSSRVALAWIAPPRSMRSDDASLLNRSCVLTTCNTCSSVVLRGKAASETR